MIEVVADYFDLDQIANSGQCFRFFKVGEKTYDIVAGYRVLRISQQQDTIYFDCSEEEFFDYWTHYFMFYLDYHAFEWIIENSNDQFLIDAYHYGSGIRILHQDLWEVMVSFIISQRKSIPAIKTSIERLCKAYGEKIEGTKYYSFPGPEKLVDLSENDCGLGYRKEYIEILSRQVINGEFNLSKLYLANYDDAKKMLLSVKGIGKKVANCILLFGLGHLDAFPVDVWIQRVLDEHYPDGFPFEKYESFGGLVQQYMFYYVRNNT